MDPLGGHGPPARVLFAENVCKNKRIGSRRGGGGGMRRACPLDPPMPLTGDWCAEMYLLIVSKF